MPLPIHIRFDGPPGPESGRFIKVEQGTQSINLGEWVQDGDDWLLVLPKPYERLVSLNAELQEAYRFVEMAGYADNSGDEYHPICQECESVFANHKDDCALNVWLERNKEE